MENLSTLLKIENSNLAWVLRLGLHGLRAQLKEARNKYTTDIGISECEELLRELDRLLQPSAVLEPEAALEPILEASSIQTSPPDEDNDSPFDPVPQDSPLVYSSPEELKLSHLRETFMADQKLVEYVGELELSSTKDADLWNEVQYLLLRVPEREASSWRTQAIDLAKEVGVSITEDKKYLMPLPLIGNFSQDKKVIYPGIKVNGKDKVGLYWSEKQGLDARLTTDELEEELNLLAGVVSICLKFIEMDSNLYHALKSVERFSVISVNSDSQKDRYSAALINRFQRAVAADRSGDPVENLRGRLDLDEAIHSLVYSPPSARHSWWDKLQQQARDTLQQVADRARNAGHKVDVRSLWGPYANVRDRSKDDLEIRSGGTPGEVSACLRVYAKIDEEVLPGRVLFRSLR